MIGKIPTFLNNRFSYNSIADFLIRIIESQCPMIALTKKGIDFPSTPKLNQIYFSIVTST